MVPNAQINDSVLVTLGDQGGSDVGIDTLTLHDLFIWKKFLDILVHLWNKGVKNFNQFLWNATVCFISSRVENISLSSLRTKQLKM